MERPEKRPEKKPPMPGKSDYLGTNEVYRRLKSLLVGATLSVLLGACQTAPHVGFQTLKEGMEKDQVLEAVGNPTRTQRWQGKDRWIYQFYVDKERAPDVKEIHFAEGKVVYLGGPVAPAISAADQDAANVISNRDAEKSLMDDYNAKQGLTRTPTAPSADEPPKTVPRFEPIN